MRLALALLLTVATLIRPAAAADPPVVRTVYSATVSGMSCLQCKRYVKKSFAKLPGVDKSSFTMDQGALAGTTIVSFASTSAKLTRDQAVESLGDRSAQYSITDFGATGTVTDPPAKRKSPAKKKKQAGPATAGT